MLTNQRRPLLIMAIVMASSLPWQISFNMVPIPSFVNELVSVLGWGMLALTLKLDSGDNAVSRGMRALLASLALLALVPLLQWLLGQTRLVAVYAQWVYFLGAATLAMWLGYRIVQSEGSEEFLDAWSWSWLAGCALSVMAIFSQYLMLDISWYWVAPVYDAGRMGGNIRQPNHMATLLAMGLPCVAWLLGRSKLGTTGAVAAIVAITVGVVMTASRTGQLMLVVVAVAFLIDPKTRKPAYALIGSALVVLAALFLLDAYQFRPFYGAARMRDLATVEDATALTGSRLDLWIDTLTMIRQHPLVGTGLGQFEFYRLLSDLPSQIRTLFTNAHNLPLHLAAELGLPVCAAVLGLWGYAAWLCRSSVRSAAGRFAVLGIACVAIHSLFEFPLWYAYLLLPTGFLVGVACATANPPRQILAAEPVPSSRATQAAGALLFLGALVAVPHYLALAAIYAPGGDRDGFTGRIETAKKAYLYGHWVMFGVLDSVTFESISHNPELLEAYSVNARFFMNDRYLARYALALAESGKDAEAGRIIRSLEILRSSQLGDLRSYAERTQTRGGKVVLSYLASRQLPLADAASFR